MSLIKNIEKINIHGEKIIKICNNTAYVEMNAPIHALAQELTENKIPSIAVLNELSVLSGIIISRTLFELLAKPYGRDLLFRKTASEIMIKPRTFLYNEYISDVHEHLKDDFLLDEIQYYALIDQKKRFRGMFSSKDLLLHIAAVQHQETIATETLQKKMIPPYSAFENNGFNVLCASVMSQRIGGDYYFVKKIDNHRTFYCLCDISGKGMSAAIITAVIAGFMGTLIFTDPLDSIVIKLNDLILKTCSLEKYATGIFCIFDDTDNTLEYCDMGHALLFEVSGSSIRQIQENSDNIPIGVMKLDSIITKKITVQESSTFIILSDGITEQQNEHSLLFSIDILPELISCNKDDLKKIKISLFEAFFLFKKNTVQHDDASILLFSLKKSPIEEPR